jgi:hypothetical protein
LDTNKNSITIYVKLLDEGTDVYRPVKASIVNSDHYKLDCPDIYDPDDEHWEFPPGSCVIAITKQLTHGSCLVAIAQVE